MRQAEAGATESSRGAHTTHPAADSTHQATTARHGATDRTMEQTTAVRHDCVVTRRRLAGLRHLPLPLMTPATTTKHSSRLTTHTALFPLVDLWFLPRDAMRNHGLCCRPVSVCMSVLNGSQKAEDIVKLFLGPVVPSV